MSVKMVFHGSDLPGVLNASVIAGGMLLTLECDTAPAETSLLVMTYPLPSTWEMTTSRTTDATHAAAILRIDERFGVHFTPGPTLRYYELNCDARFDALLLGGKMPKALDVAQSGTRNCASASSCTRAWRSIHAHTIHAHPRHPLTN